MNQLYAEAGVKRKDTTKTMLLRALLVVGIVAGVFVMFLGSFFSIVGAVIIVLMGYLFPRLNVEYEYVFCDGQLDFDKIMGKSKRKTALRIDFEQVEIMAPSKSHALDGYTYANCVLKDFSSGKETQNAYTIIANIEDKKTKILFEPSEKMITMMKQKSPRKIAQY
ncbi:MAG: hypothetical protein K0S47_2954 [Herbinix sp.]|jgi:hypothetical protein|nr:hypothetical protein [Herbinix sp.]